ncbi:uncharacterized protein RHOBADRAFT_42316 [Rhodotorula graminis WP1]|uniref:F-box domain-containing protein n=1 Tax=Rhodotorula graminis (strain WP1) TaxID=578459 RepID=A0A194S9G3_RHOGW|nr:uncharacterized protein RHOBADRAFT_42316 [Rhodotorula graminis WP1]KPV77105.1 hypothetical protein RHOBADRAFT_42316 [Rhodotorula graminis WP1]
MASHQLRATTDATRDTADTVARPERERDDHEQEDAGSSNSLSQAGKRGKDDGDKDNTQAQDDDEQDAQPAAKKRRTTSSTTKVKGTARVKGKKGKLSAFLAMPLDLLVEVAQHTDPPTLLAMSRTNKLMHNLFARRSAAPIWAAVRRNVDFPELEASDLSEMQLASLVFDRNCHLCGRGRAVIVDYALRIRWCKPCERANLVRKGDLRLQEPAVHVHKLALACSFFTLHSGKSHSATIDHHYCLPQLRAASDCLDIPRRTRRPEDEILNADPTSHDLVGKHVVDRVRLVKLVQEDAATLAEWDGATPSAREEAYAAAHALRNRKALVKQKLLSMGFADADIALSSNWNVLLPTIIIDADRRRAARLDLERVSRIWRRHDALKLRYSIMRSTGDDEPGLSFPSWSNFRLLPSVESLWVPEGDVVSDEQWQAALPSILVDLVTARRVLKLKKPEAPLKPTGALFFEADLGSFDRRRQLYSRMYMYGPVGFLDFGDTADGVDEAELDALLSQAVATFIGISSGVRATLVPYSDIVPMLDKYCGSGGYTSFDGLFQAPSVRLVQEQLAVLKRAGLPNHRSSIAKLEELGPVFECHGCDAALPRSARRSHLRVVVKSTSLSWSEMVYHACTAHYDLYASDGVHTLAATPAIRLSTSTDSPPSSSPSLPSTTMTATADAPVA